MSILEEGEPHIRILELAKRERVDLIVVNKAGSLLGGLIPFSGMASIVAAQSNTDILVIPQNASLNLERILLAFDESAESEAALNRAIELSVAYGSELTIMNAFEVPLEGFSYKQEIWDEVHQKAIELLKIAEKAAKNDGVRHLKTEMKHGRAAGEIHKLARAIQTGLIILGSHQKKVLKNILLENVMNQVIRNDTNPVWIAKR